MTNNISIDADFVINEQPDIQADLHINFSPDVSNFVTREELAEDLADKQDVLTAGDNIQIEDNVISATDTTYTAGEGISIEDNVISNTQTSTEWGNVKGDIADQTDLIDLIDTKIDIEATARENNDLLLQNGINTLNNDLTAEISNRGTADGILQDNIDTLSGTVSNNYTTLDGKISDNKTAIDNHIADKTNPHEVTKSQVGLGNVDNTSDLNKPISTATQNALNTKVSNTREINGYALSSDITLTASDVDALPDTTKYVASINLSIDSSTYVITAQLKDQNGNNIGTAQTIDLPLESVVVGGSYDSTNKKVVLTLESGSTIEFSVADLVSGLQTEITSSNKLDADLVDDSTSTNKFATASQLAQIGTNQTNIGTINNTIGGYGDIVTHDTDEFATAAQGALADTAVQPADLSTVATTGDYDDLLNKPTIPAAQVNSDWNASSGVAQILNKPTLSTVATSGDYNDLSNKPTIPTVNNATLTITQGGTTKGTFTANAGTDVTIDLDAGGGSSTDVQINGTSITSGGVADIITEGVYDATDNKIATMSDLADKQDVLTAGTNINIVSVPPSEPVDTRSTATVSTVGSSNWQEVAYINGKFIAVGNSGNIMTSTDGETWGTPYKKGSYTWRGIAYGNNTYVICGNNGRVAYSTDGENWTNTTAGTLQLNDVIFVNNTFIAVSAGKYLATSTDGENWTVSQSTVFSNKPFDISYYNGVYIVCEESGKVETSTDLLTWTTKTVGAGTWNAVVYAFGKYVIAGAGGYMSYSTDLSTWASPFQVGTEEWQELVLGDGYLVAIGNSGNTSTTTDGETWTTIVTIGSSNWYGLACNGSNYVAVGVSGATTTFEITNGQEGGTVINGAEIVSSVDSTSTNSQCVGAKLFYDTVGDIETALNTINSGVSA